MKKLIGIIAVLFITTGLFGQKFIRSHSFIEATPTGNNTIEDAMQNDVPDGNYEWVRYVHFIRDGKLYLLSYEPNSDFRMGVDRSVYLYYKDTSDADNPWVKASNVVMTSNWWNTRNYTEVDFFRKDKSRGSKGEVFIVDDIVYITIGFESMTNGRLQIDEPITYGFRPVGNGSYHTFLSYQRVSHDTGSTL